MVGAVERDEAAAPGPPLLPVELERELERDLDRGGAVVAEEDALQPGGRDRDQLLGEAGRGLVRDAGERGVREAAGLRRERGHEPGVAVTEGGDVPARVGVEVAAPVEVEEARALGAIDDERVHLFEVAAHRRVGVPEEALVRCDDGSALSEGVGRHRERYNPRARAGRGDSAAALSRGSPPCEGPRMQLTPAGQQKINDLAQRYAVSVDAVTTLLQAVVNGQGTMAQFYHPELGGGGQWMAGGMTMVGDMFNHGLKAKVDGLCAELSNLLASQPFVPPPQAPMGGGQQQQQGGYGGQQQGYGGGGSAVSLFVPAAGGGSGNWWPGDLGRPSSTGSQNNVRYAYFPGSRRLAVEVNGRVSVYDTLDHQIGGVSQQQGSGASVTFTSQYGVVSVLSLPILSGDLAAPSAPVQPQPPPQQTSNAVPPPPAPPPPAPRASGGQEADIFASIERLADLRQKGVLTEDEFSSKKSELLARL